MSQGNRDGMVNINGKIKKDVSSLQVLRFLMK